jgi:hypothetical protein
MDMDVVPLKSRIKNIQKYSQNVYILFPISNISRRKCGTETLTETVLNCTMSKFAILSHTIMYGSPNDL